MITGLIWFLIYAVIIGFVLWVAAKLIGAVPMLAPYKEVLTGVLVLVAVIILLLLLLQLLGGGPPPLRIN